MHLKHWIETYLKRKNWTIQKLKEEIDNIKQDEEYKLHIKKINEIEIKNIPDKDKRELINLEKNNFSSNSDKAGIGLSTISRILNSREKYPSERTIKKLESALGSFNLFLKEEVYNKDKFNKGICFEEETLIRKHWLSEAGEEIRQCDTCARRISSNEGSFHKVIISTKNDKRPIAWTRDTKSDSAYPQFTIRICKTCRNEFNEEIKKDYSELVNIIIKTLKIKQKDAALKLKTTQPTIFKILNNRIEYIDNTLAKRIHQLALRALKEKKAKTIKTPFLTKDFYHTLAKRIEDELNESAINLQENYKNLKKEKLNPEKTKVTINVEYKKTFLAKFKTSKEENRTFRMIDCDFSIEYIIKSTSPEFTHYRKAIVFITNHQYNEGHERNYHDYITVKSLEQPNILCLMPIHELVINDYNKPLSCCQFFVIDRSDLIKMPYKRLFELDYSR